MFNKDFEPEVNPGLELGSTEERGCSKLRRGSSDAYGFDIEEGREDPSPIEGG